MVEEKSLGALGVVTAMPAYALPKWRDVARSFTCGSPLIVQNIRYLSRQRIRTGALPNTAVLRLSLEDPTVNFLRTLCFVIGVVLTWLPRAGKIKGGQGATTGGAMSRNHERFVSAVSSIQSSENAAKNVAVQEHSVASMLGTIGSEMLAAGTNGVNEVDSVLTDISRAYGRADIKTVSLPTFVLVEDPATSPPSTAVFPTGEMSGMRLDQVGEMQAIIREALRSCPSPTEITARVAEVVQTPPRFGFWRSLIGHFLLTLGFGLVINPSAAALPVYAVLGVVVGIIVLLGAKMPTLSLVLPVFAAFIATAIAGIAAETFVHDNTLRLVAPSLVSLLPGMILAVAAVELTNGQVIAGSSRLLYGFARLAMLSFGVYLGIIAFGVKTDTAASTERLGSWAPWVGLLLVAMGYYLYAVAPKKSLLWVALALILAHAGQLLGNLLLGNELSGMLGAIIAVPCIYLASHLVSAPPPAVMLTCAYWVLVPGSMGFIGLSEAASGTAGAGNMIVETLGAILAIAIGMVIGTGLSREAGTFARSLKNSPAHSK